jgi:uncharacterized membrane protein YfcA
MDEISTKILAVALTFALGGLVKGVAGMGLPTVAMGVLGLLMAPAQAAALVVVPSLITNVWQFLAGRHRLMLLRRMWSMLLMICIVTWLGTRLMTGTSSGTAAIGLGLALIVYAAIGLARVRISVRRKQEAWLSPVMGAMTGIVTGATGILVIPAGLYLQALGFEKDDLVQVLGLSFTTSTIALAAGLASWGTFQLTDSWASTLCTAPALAGMVIGQAIRARINPAAFRLLFLIGLLLLGLDLVVRPFI